VEKCVSIRGTRKNKQNGFKYSTILSHNFFTFSVTDAKVSTKCCAAHNLIFSTRKLLRTRKKEDSKRIKMADSAIPANTVGMMKEEDTSSHGGAEDAERNSTKDGDDAGAASDVEAAGGEDKLEETDAVAIDLTPRKTKPFIVLVACCAALGGLIFGYDIAGKTDLTIHDDANVTMILRG
jgi:hypothetical protein